MAPDLNELPGFSGLPPERQANVVRGMTDQAYFQGRVTTLLEVLDVSHRDCKAERITNEGLLFKAVNSLQLSRAKLVALVMGVAVAGGLLSMMLSKMLDHITTGKP